MLDTISLLESKIDKQVKSRIGQVTFPIFSNHRSSKWKTPFKRARLSATTVV
jgi:hypothetical protein